MAHLLTPQHIYIYIYIYIYLSLSLSSPISHFIPSLSLFLFCFCFFLLFFSLLSLSQEPDELPGKCLGARGSRLSDTNRQKGKRDENSNITRKKRAARGKREELNQLLSENLSCSMLQQSPQSRRPSRRMLVWMKCCYLLTAIFLNCQRGGFRLALARVLLAPTRHLQGGIPSARRHQWPCQWLAALTSYTLQTPPMHRADRLRICTRIAQTWNAPETLLPLLSST